MSTFTEQLRARGESGLVALLRVRPDLSAPAPSSVRSLAARAANRTSLERALVALDAQALALLDATLGLDGAARAQPNLTVRDVSHAMGLAVSDLGDAVRTCLTAALLWTNAPGGDAAWGPDAELDDLALHPAPGLDDVLGPYPAGLGPSLESSLARRTPQTLARLAADIGVEVEGPRGDSPAGSPAVSAAEGSMTSLQADALLTALVRRLAEPSAVLSLLDQAPRGARAVVEALAWGPPVGRSPSTGADRTTGTQGPARGAVDWLVRHGLLAVGDPQHVVLPREVALALRGGRTHRDVPLPPQLTGTPTTAVTVEAESARHAEEIVRQVEAVIHAWGQDQPLVLRSGGLGSRELRRLAGRLEVDERTVALVVEIAGATGLVADDGEEQPRLTPTTDADPWLRRSVPERWVTLAEAWLASERAAWLVGTRDERGNLRSALDPELRRPWAPRLRRSVLEVLVSVGTPTDPAGMDAAALHEALQWRTPRAAPPLHAVEAVLEEARLVGIVGAGAVGAAGRALLAGPAAPGVDGGLAGDSARSGVADPAAALAAAIPPAVDHVLLQGDLTGIVPGRPAPDLAALLELASHVESRGAGVTVRFTEASVRTALDSGLSAEDLLAELSSFARSGVPQPLEYLVLDAARRHGQVRVGAASSYLRADDPSLLLGLVENRALSGLGLLRLAPTVIAAQAPISVVLAALREQGLAPVAEGPEGQVVVVRPAPRRVRGAAGGRRPPPRPSGTGAPAGTPPSAAEALERRLRRLAKELLLADRREQTTLLRGERPADAADVAEAPAGTPQGLPGTPDPVLALALLREAVAQGSEVWLEMIGPDGAPSRRRVRPLRVDGGRVRALDAEREAELTIAVHRIARVTPT